MNQNKFKTSLVGSGKKYPEIIDEVKGKKFQDLINPPKNLSTPRKRFKLQKKLFRSLSDNIDISWEEAKFGLKPLPSFTAPLEFYQDLKIVKMPDKIVENAEKKRIYALAILNHPERIRALIKARNKVYKKPSLAHSRALDRAEVKKRLITFSNVAAIQPDLMSDRLHRRKLLTQGPFVPTSLKKETGIRLPLTTGSMVTGNPEMIASSAMCGVLTFTYKEGLCSVPEIQAEVTKSAVEILLRVIDDPLWKGRPDKKELLNFWLSQIGITTGTNIRDAIKRVRLLLPLIKKAKLPSLAIRIYNPQVSKETVKTVSALRKEYGDLLEIFAGQANSVEAVQELVEAGASAVGQGIAGGMRCTTSIVSGVAVSVLRDLWRMRGKVDAPLFVDSSVSYYWSLAYLLGASMLVKPSHFIGIESTGAMFPFTNNKNYYIPYNGEASAINKEQTGRLMENGRPFAPEGVGGFAKIDLQLPTIPDQVLDAIINFLVPPFVFQGTSSGRRFETIEDMHKESDLEFLWEMSEESRKIRGAWGPTFHKR